MRYQVEFYDNIRNIQSAKGLRLTNDIGWQEKCVDVIKHAGLTGILTRYKARYSEGH